MVEDTGTRIKIPPTVELTEEDLDLIIKATDLLPDIAAGRIKPDEQSKEMILKMCMLGLRETIAGAVEGYEDDLKSLQEICASVWPVLPDTPAPIARASEFTGLMWNLAHVVKPACANTTIVLHGPIVVDEDQKDNPADSRLAKSYAIAKKHWKPRTTLKALTMRAYLERLHSQGFHSISERSIARDLQEFRRQLARHEGYPPLRRYQLPSGEELLLLPGTVSMGWKERKRAKQLSDKGDQNLTPDSLRSELSDDKSKK